MTKIKYLLLLILLTACSERSQDFHYEIIIDHQLIVCEKIGVYFSETVLKDCEAVSNPGIKLIDIHHPVNYFVVPKGQIR